MISLVRGLSENDLVLALISGGGSALLTLPAPALDLQDKQAVTEKLLKSGAAIAEINCVRKHLSAIKGGTIGRDCLAGAGSCAGYFGCTRRRSFRHSVGPHSGGSDDQC
jgi:glycerate-2-kinase